MKYVVVGVNHKTAPVALREKLVLSENDDGTVLKSVTAKAPLGEILILSTCNRVEVYGASSDPFSVQKELTAYFERSLPDDVLGRALYSYTERETVAHLFRVASSLDSLVVGENQIAKQVREAHQTAMASATSGPYLNRLFNRALFVAKRVKTETEIAKGNVSVGSAGVSLAKKIFGSLEDRVVTLFGAGEIGELVLRYLKSSGKGRSFIVNRHFDKAQKLEETGLGKAIPLEKLESALLESDILVTSIARHSESLNENFFKEILLKRGNAPLFIIDLGVPRNVDPVVGKITNVYLYDIDDLKSVAEDNRSLREGEIVSAENIIDEETRLFYEDYLENEALPTIAGLNRKFDEIRRRELDKTLAKMPHLNEADRDQLELMTRAIVSRVLRGPISTLKRKQTTESALTGLMRMIFSLDDEVQDE